MRTFHKSCPQWFGVLLVAIVLTACGGSSPDSGSSLAASETAKNGNGFGAQLPRAPVEPLGAVGVPDINALGLLDQSGPNSASWPKMTNAGQKTKLQALGKALFWDMQVGGDGIQACASCHFNAGADNRVANQVNPGTNGVTDVTALNTTLNAAHFLGTANGALNGGLAVSESGLLAAGFTPDAADGTPGAKGGSAAGDIDDVVSSQGVRSGVHQGVSTTRVDYAVLDANDARAFNRTFNSPAPGIPNTVRRVPGRNSPSALNAIYNLRNFWDGRANMFFNGVNPLGVNDPDARVKAYVGGNIIDERLDLPFSSLASQAVGPIDSDFEMTNAGRPNADLGKKLTGPGVLPLAGQTVDAGDSLLGDYRDGSGRGLSKSYVSFIRETFDQRFWGDGSGNDVCVNAAGARETAVAGACPTYSLLQYNFPLFFGLAVQAYEATLTTSDTIVDLIAGGKATGVVVSGRARIDVAGMALDGCVRAVQLNNAAANVDAALQLCAAHYAKFIHPGAVSGAESGLAPNPVPPGSPIGGCTNPATCSASPNELHGVNTLLNVNRGLGRFFAGATACSVCHFNPEFTGATVSTVTRFGARLPALPNGQLRKELEARAVLERMPIFSGAPAVYDVGFYNLGVRPTATDVSIGDSIGGVPISIGSILNIANGGRAGANDVAKTKATADLLINKVKIPSSPLDLTPQPFPTVVGCAIALTGGLNG
ncbi:MAG: cytochrome c peroxidase, partial [Burkholderiaceae bacterium]